MRRLPLVVVAATMLAAALAPHLAGAAPLNSVEVTAGEPVGQASQGSFVTIPVLVDNGRLQPVTIEFPDVFTTALVARARPTSVTVPAQEARTVTFEVLVAHDAPVGAASITLAGREVGGPVAGAVDWSNTTTLSILASDGRVPWTKTGGAYVLFAPALTNVSIDRGTSEPVALDLLNPTNGTQRLALSWLLPPGYTAGSAPGIQNYSADDRATVRLTLERNVTAPVGSARFIARDAATGALRGFATLRMMDRRNVTEPPPDDNTTRSIDWPLVHNFTRRASEGAATFPFDVPSGTRGLAWAARTGPELNASGARFTIALYDPTGARQPACGDPCSATLDDPAPGAWRIAFEGTSTFDAAARIVLTPTPPLHVLLAPWKLERDETHVWDGPDATSAFTLNDSLDALILEIWRANATQPDGDVELRDAGGAHRLSCGESRCWLLLRDPPAGAWSLTWTGPGVGGALARVYTLAGAPEPAPEPEPGPDPGPDPDPAPIDRNETIEPPGVDRTIGDANRTLDPSPILLTVEPIEIRVDAGGAAEAVVRIHSRDQLPRALVLTLSAPPSFNATLEGAPAEIVPGDTIDVRLRIRASLNASPGRFDARVDADGSLGAAFAILVALPPPPEEPKNQSAPTAATTEAPPSLAPLYAGTAAGVGALALGFAFVRRRWPFAFAALYAKLRPSKVLQHDARRRLVDIVRAEPGVPLGELQRRLDLANGEIAHHLHVLERSRVLVSSRDGQLRRIYPIEMGRPPRVDDLGERALALLAAQPRTLSALARDLGTSRQAVYYHVKKLVASGRIEAHPDGTLRAADATRTMRR